MNRSMCVTVRVLAQMVSLSVSIGLGLLTARSTAADYDVPSTEGTRTVSYYLPVIDQSKSMGQPSADGKLVSGFQATKMTINRN